MATQAQQKSSTSTSTASSLRELRKTNPHRTRPSESATASSGRTQKAKMMGVRDLPVQNQQSTTEAESDESYGATGLIEDVEIGDDASIDIDNAQGQSSITKVRTGDAPDIQSKTRQGQNIIKGIKAGKNFKLKNTVDGRSVEEREKEGRQKSDAKQVGISPEQFAQLRSELEALKQEQKLSGEQVRAIIELSEKLSKQVADLPDDETLRQIGQSPKLQSYYQELRKLRYHFIAAYVLMSGRVSHADDIADLAIKGSAQLGKHIPIASIWVTLFEQGASFANGAKKQQAMRHLADWVPSLTLAENLAESFARQLTLKKAAEIENPQQVLDTHPAKGYVEKICAVAKTAYDGATKLAGAAGQVVREAKEGRIYSSEERLALADTIQVLDSIMGGKIHVPTHDVGNERVEPRLKLMLAVFNGRPTAQATSASSSSFSSAMSARPSASPAQPAKAATRTVRRATHFQVAPSAPAAVAVSGVTVNSTLTAPAPRGNNSQS